MGIRAEGVRRASDRDAPARATRADAPPLAPLPDSAPAPAPGAEAARPQPAHSDGVVGDRIVRVRDGNGLITGQAGRLVPMRSGTGPDGQPPVEGQAQRGCRGYLVWVNGAPYAVP